MAGKKSMKGKGSYASYKTSGMALKNKIKKLERHCKKFPDDKSGKENLERIKKEGYIGRTRPLAPGSNPTTPKVRLSNETGHLFGPKTAGQQLSELLGIPIPTQRRKKNFKPKVTHKPRRK